MVKVSIRLAVGGRESLVIRLGCFIPDGGPARKP
jgi:hypothetical protein